MATQRPRRTGGGVQPVYEDFKPASNWSQNDDAYILTLQAPGFMRGQLKVTAEERNIIRVRGERLVAGNKWSRFQEDFKFPDNAQLTSVRAKHQGDNLIITVPKKNKPSTQPPTLSPLPPKTQHQLLSPETTHMAYKESLEIRQQKQKGEEKPAAAQQTGLVDTGKKILDDKTYDRLGGIKKTENIEKKGVQETKQKPATPEKAQLHQDHHANIKESEKQKQIVKYDSPNHGALHKYKKKAAKGVSELNEERQLLVNVGAALLVIVALSAYVSYNFATRSPP